MLNSVFWNLFKTNGNIKAYIAYKKFLDLENKISLEAKKELQ